MCLNTDLPRAWDEPDDTRDTSSGSPDDLQRPCISFSGCAMLYPYHLGVAQYVIEHFDTTHVRAAGMSGGFTGALTVATGFTAHEHWVAFSEARACWDQRWLGPFFVSTREWMRPYMGLLQPYEKALLAASRAGRLSVGVTTILPSTRHWPLKHTVKATFATIKEFVYTVTCSQRIMPFYRSPGYMDGRYALDGGFSALFTHPHRSAPHRTVRVCPWDIGVFSDVHPRLPWLPHRLLIPPTRSTWDHLMRAGYADARRAHAAFTRAGFQRKPTPPSHPPSPTPLWTAPALSKPPSSSVAAPTLTSSSPLPSSSCETHEDHVHFARVLDMVGETCCLAVLSLQLQTAQEQYLSCCKARARLEGEVVTLVGRTRASIADVVKVASLMSVYIILQMVRGLQAFHVWA